MLQGQVAFRLYFRTYATSDGLVSVAGMSTSLYRRFHEATGITRPPSGAGASDPGFLAVVDEAERCFASATTGHWMGVLRAIGYPCSRYNRPDEAIEDPQVVANDLVVGLDHPVFGHYVTTGMPLRMEATPVVVRGPSPCLGAHTVEVLTEIGFDPRTHRGAVEGRCGRIRRAVVGGTSARRAAIHPGRPMIHMDDRTGGAIPRPTPPYEGTIGRLTGDCEPTRMELDGAPEGAPNVVIVLLDDVGFGSFSTFGGPVPAPALERVAADGLRFNQFHTTAICAPTRAALLTGRNHHTVHMGRITEAANSFPAFDTVIPREAATIAEVLRQNGYTTGMFGKGHLTPQWEMGPADRSTGGPPASVSTASTGSPEPRPPSSSPTSTTRPPRSPPTSGAMTTTSPRTWPTGPSSGCNG